MWCINSISHKFHVLQSYKSNLHGINNWFYHGVQIPVKAPGRGYGELEITYLDEELRWVWDYYSY